MNRFPIRTLLCVTSIAVTLTGQAQPPLAGCHIATDQAQLCQSGIAAAIAYRRQNEAARTDGPQASATADLLRRSGCRMAGAEALRMDVEEIARGPVGLPEGKLDVVSIRLDHAAYWYIAADWLTAGCTVAAGSMHTP